MQPVWLSAEECNATLMVYTAEECDATLMVNCRVQLSRQLSRVPSSVQF